MSGNVSDVNRELGKHLAELFNLPFEKMRAITVKVEAKSVPTIEVEYLALGERATHLTSTVDEDEDVVRTEKKTYRVEVCQ